jgi:peptide/nickel transport system substrate-binding protein
VNNDLEQPSLYWRIRRAISAFGATEKIVFGFFAIIFVLSALIVLQKINRSFMTDVPVRGGTLEEGVVGFPSAVNPLIAYTDADKDLVALVYSGLLRQDSNGQIITDLAQSWTVSEDGLTYSFKLKPELTFHDGVPLTADDVVFTIQRVKDDVINSPKASNWTGVSVEKVSDLEIRFTLKKAYAPFVYNMTLGILPKHIWESIDAPLFSRSTYNQEPIGSGPYRVKSAKSKDGFYEYYDLAPFENYALGAAHLEHIIMRFYKTEEAALAAYNLGSVKALGGISPESADVLVAQGANIKRIPLPRIFGIFFNQSHATVFLNKEVRQAFDVAINRDTLIKQVLHGYGVRATSPIPAGFISTEDIAATRESTTTASEGELAKSIEEAKDILLSNGWKPNEQGILSKKVTRNGSSENVTLAFTLTTPNVPELKRTAEIVRDTWNQLGASVTLNIVEPGELNQNIIKPRAYDALLFGNVVGRDLDLYPFWHSSQRNDPGLNIAMYANLKADRLLETARTTASSTIRNTSFQDFEKEIISDIPAVFLYSPEYIYVLPKKIQNAEISKIVSSSERFSTIYKWYTDIDGVWNIFIKNQ